MPVAANDTGAMIGIYVALVGVAATVWVFLVGGAAAVAQLVATQVSPAALRFVWWTRPFIVGVLLLFAATVTAFGLAVALAGPHPTEVESPMAAVASGAALTVAAMLTAWSVVRGVRLLDPLNAVVRLLRDINGGDWSTWVLAVQPGVADVPSFETSHEDACTRGCSSR